MCAHSYKKSNSKATPVTEAQLRGLTMNTNNITEHKPTMNNQSINQKVLIDSNQTSIKMKENKKIKESLATPARTHTHAHARTHARTPHRTTAAGNRVNGRGPADQGQHTGPRTKPAEAAAKQR